MVIMECNTDELKNRMQEHPNSLFYRVCRAPIYVKGVKGGLTLAPNKELHQVYQGDKISWAEYVPEYRAQIENNPKAQELLKKIKKEAET